MIFKTIVDQQKTIIAQNAKILTYLKLLFEGETNIMATLDDVLADVRSETTVIESVKTYVEGLKGQLTAAQAANDPAKLQAVIDAIDANKAAQATITNTPAASG